MRREGTTTMSQLRSLIGSLIVIALVAVGCSNDGSDTTTTEMAGLPNPASVYCEDQGGTVEIRTDAAGNQYGICVFDDGSECDEWAFYRGECAPGEGQVPEPLGPQPGLANPASEFCEEQGGRLEIRDEAGGEAGYCIGPNGVECPEWAFFYGECTWGDAGE